MQSSYILFVLLATTVLSVQVTDITTFVDTYYGKPIFRRALAGLEMQSLMEFESKYSQGLFQFPTAFYVDISKSEYTRSSPTFKDQDADAIISVDGPSVGKAFTRYVVTAVAWNGEKRQVATTYYGSCTGNVIGAQQSRLTQMEIADAKRQLTECANKLTNKMLSGEYIVGHQ